MTVLGFGAQERAAQRELLGKRTQFFKILFSNRISDFGQKHPHPIFFLLAFLILVGKIQEIFLALESRLLLRTVSGRLQSEELSTELSGEPFGAEHKSF